MACFSRLQYFDKEKALCEIMKNCRIVNLLCAVCFAIFFAGCTSPYIGKNRQEIVDIIAQEHKKAQGKIHISDNQAERVYSAEINDFYEVSSLATETFDKQKQIWHCEGEWFANRVSKNTETRFPPKIVYLSESKIKDFLSGKILVGE